MYIRSIKQNTNILSNYITNILDKKFNGRFNEFKYKRI